MRLFGIVLLTLLLINGELLAQKDGQLLDSIVQVQFHSEQDSTFFYKNVYRYDNDGREVYSNVVGFNSYKNSWIVSSFKEVKYDGQGRVCETIRYINPPTGPWEIIYSYFQKTLEFDNLGNPIYEFQFGKRSSNDEWTPINLMEKKTNENGLLVQRIFYVWNLDNEQWEPQKLHTHSYNTHDLEVLISTDIWNSDSMKWSPSARFERNYDERGNKIFEGEYIRNQDSIEWILFNPSYWEYDSLNRVKKHQYPSQGDAISGRDEYEYDSLGNITIYHYSKIYLPRFQDWTLKTKLIKSYNGIEQLIRWEEYLRDSVYWKPYQKFENLYNNKDLLWRRVTFRGDYLTSQWKEAQLSVYHYNDQDNLALIENINPDNQRITAKEYYYYSGSLFTSKLEFPSDISVYPNPTNGLIYLDDKLGPYTVDIYSIHGLLLKSHEKQTKSIDLSALPNGAYCLIIRNNDLLLRKLIIKN